jgi:hypothetical protein
VRRGLSERPTTGRDAETAHPGVHMVTTKNEFFRYDAFIYMFTASGGLIFSYLLYVSGLIPRFLAVLGLIAYISLAIGIPVSLLGDVQLDEGWGLIFVGPGAVFEFVVPLLLIIKGFSTGAKEPRPGGDQLSDSAEPIAIADLGLTGAAPTPLGSAPRSRWGLRVPATSHSPGARDHRVTPKLSG